MIFLPRTMGAQMRPGVPLSWRKSGCLTVGLRGLSLGRLAFRNPRSGRVSRRVFRLTRLSQGQSPSAGRLALRNARDGLRNGLLICLRSARPVRRPRLGPGRSGRLRLRTVIPVSSGRTAIVA